MLALASRGATVHRIMADQIRAMEIPVPPLAEQRRIVGVLDEAFASLATAQAHAAQNLQNARALFESHLNAIFTERGEGWERITLEELLQRGWIEGHLDGNHGSDYPKKDEFIIEGVPYISANCIVEDRVVMAKSKFLSPQRAAMLRKGIARNNDVLFAHNATVGPVAILRTTEAKVILGTSLTYYRCNHRHIIPEYLAHYMRSSEFTFQYSQVMKQSTRNQVPITKQREFFHIIPPIEEQKEIASSLEGLLENSQRLIRIYEQKLAALAELKNSLLHQAFSGEL
jgi:type I restriction enzyme S subunit